MSIASSIHTALNPDAIRSSAVRNLSGSLLLAFDRDLRIVHAEGPALATLGRDPASLVGQLLQDAVVAQSYTKLAPLYRRVLAGETLSFDHDADGSLWFTVSASPLYEGDEVVGLVALCRDISARRAAETERREAALHFETAFSSAPIGMALVDLDGRFMRVNPALCEITGYPEDELVEVTFQTITHPDDLEADVAQLDQVISGEIDSYQMDKRYFTKAGALVWISLSVSAVRDVDGNLLHFISQITDISEQRRMMDRLQELAERDTVTDLFNRRRFEDELKRQAARSHRYGEKASVVVVDLDDFKSINDRFGHTLGDIALRAVARVMRQRLRTTDIVARVGGDEFSVLLPNTDLKGATLLADDLRKSIATAPIALGGHNVPITVSVGVHTLRPGPGADPFAEADRAMYRAKAAGKDQIALAP